MLIAMELQARKGAAYRNAALRCSEIDREEEWGPGRATPRTAKSSISPELTLGLFPTPGPSI